MGNTALPLSTEVLGLTGQTKVRLGTSVGKTCSDIQGKGQESTRKAPTLSASLLSTPIFPAPLREQVPSHIVASPSYFTNNLK